MSSSKSSDTESSPIATPEEALLHRPAEADYQDLIDRYSGSLDDWDKPWDGDIEDPPPAHLGIEVTFHPRWWGFELHCNEPAVRVIEFIRRTIVRIIARALPPPVPRLVALALRVRAVVVRRMSRGNGLRFISPWISPLQLTPWPLPRTGEPELPSVDDQKMRWSVFDPRRQSAPDAWSDPMMFEALESADSPALAEFQGKLYCVYRGSGWDTALYWTSYDPNGPATPDNPNSEGWSTPRRLPLSTHRSATAPALAAYRNELHCFYMQDSGTTQRLVGARFSGGTWHPPHFTFGETINTRSGPSLVVAPNNDFLHCFFENAGRLQYVVMDGTNFRLRQMAPIFNAASAPSAVLFRNPNRILCVWRSQDSGIFGSAFATTGVWTDPNGTRFGGQFASGKPELVGFENEALCVHSGQSDQRLRWGPVGLSGTTPIPTTPLLFQEQHQSSTGPGLVSYTDTNMQGYQDQHLMAIFRGIRR